MVSVGCIKPLLGLIIPGILLTLLINPHPGIASKILLIGSASVVRSRPDRLTDDFVLFTAFVTDANGSPVTHLTWHDVVVTDRGHVEKIAYFRMNP